MKKLIILFFPMFLFCYQNHLINQESPYLQQHTHNPINWYPWSKEAFEKAKKENKLIFLSIGYSTCHWCHVMEKESFENKKIASILNKFFIAIKVDKEEKPNIDKFYQRIYQILQQNGGGWPLTIILTPNKRPIFAATYIPAFDRYDKNGLYSILPQIAKAYYKNPKKFEDFGKKVLEIAQNSFALTAKKTKITQFEKKLLTSIKNEFEPKFGGFSPYVKFPQSDILNLLLDYYALTRNKTALFMATKTLDNMAKGGIYDQIEGAFFRYSTKKDWSIPHFEKMLYTNAKLIQSYLKAYKISKKALYKNVVLHSISFIEKYFQSNEKLYFGASDADSNGMEGGYFIYKYDKSLQFLLTNGINKQEAKKALNNLCITKEGNFKEGFSNPCLKEKVNKKIIVLLQKMRQKRNYPFIDKKEITAWNAMYIEAKLNAAIFNPLFQKEALQSLNTLLDKLYVNGVLYHQKLPLKAPKVKAYLEDYAFLIKALITAYEKTFNYRYLKIAQTLMEQAKRKFFKNNSWYFSLGEIPIKADISDSAYTSSLTTILNNEVSLALLENKINQYEKSKKYFEHFLATINTNPAYFPSASNLYLRFKYQDVLIKSNKTNLLQHQKNLFFLPYPFILLQAQSTIKDFELCTIYKCFATTKDIKKIKEFIKKK